MNIHSACFIMGILGVQILSAETLALWPSELCAVRPQSSCSTTITNDQRIAVSLGLKTEWPGAVVYFKKETCDLRTYGQLSVTVRNTDTRPLQISATVKSKPNKEPTPTATATLQPNDESTLRIPLRKTPWVLDKPLEIVGMRGFPEALDAKSNLGAVSELHIFIPRSHLDGKPAHYEIVKIEASPLPFQLLKSETFMPFVDEFGQFKHAEWPGKVHSVAEMQAAAKQEAEWLAKAPAMPDRDSWGGWSKGPQLKATGHFRVEKVKGKWWLVDPDGRLFFSHGVDCVREGGESGTQWREAYFSWLPQPGDPLHKYVGKSWGTDHDFYKGKGAFVTYDFVRANMERKYGTNWSARAADLAHTRIHAWGLNTVANWSDPKVYLLRRTPYTATINTRGPRIEGSTGYWGKFPDPYSVEFSASIRKGMENQAKDGTTTDPWCIGYFVDNELSWGGDDMSLAQSALCSPATQPCKLAFKAWLVQKYETPEKLNAAWQTQYASWDALLASTNAPAPKICKADYEAFHREIAEQYFRTIRNILREFAPQKLYMGCRIAWGAPSVYRASAKYCDIVSVNIYSRTVNKNLPNDAEDKPMINGEFHFGALDRGMFHTGLVATESQTERAQCYVAFVTECLKHPRYVGTHWFQWKDQALTGRFDGENYQIGFLTNSDQPHPETIEAVQKVGREMYDLRFNP